jgi:hypothetical protein
MIGTRLADLTYESVRALAGSAFEVRLPDGSATTLILEHAEGDGARRAFSLYFIGSPSLVLPQGCYELRGERMAFDAIFIVPIARDATGTRYQAVFS